MDKRDRIIAELIAVLDAYEGKPTIANQGQALDGYSALANFVEVARAARAARQEQEAQQATDGKERG